MYGKTWPRVKTIKAHPVLHSCRKCLPSLKALCLSWTDGYYTSMRNDFLFYRLQCSWDILIHDLLIKRPSPRHPSLDQRLRMWHSVVLYLFIKRSGRFLQNLYIFITLLNSILISQVLSIAKTGLIYGSNILWRNWLFFRDDLVPHWGNRHSLRFSGMTIFYIIGLIIAVGLAIYLFIALLKPELFSWPPTEFFRLCFIS